VIQTLFLNNFQDANAPIHTTGTVQSWFEEHEGELQHLPWTEQSPDLNTVEPFWSVLETRVRNRFPPPISLKQLEGVLQEDHYKIPLETVQNLYKSIPRMIAAVLKAKGGPTPY
jgi:transposase